MRNGNGIKDRNMDLVYLIVTVVFFAAAIAYVHFCERVR
jgi:hypothetical protein